MFKPWRSGNDLKNEQESWDESFTNHEFTQRELEIMNNFNLRYECLDARDDFSSQLRQGAVVPDGTCPNFMTSDMMDNYEFFNLLKIRSLFNQAKWHFVIN